MRNVGSAAREDHVFEPITPDDEFEAEPSITQRMVLEMEFSGTGPRVLDDLEIERPEVDQALEKPVHGLDGYRSLPKEARRRLTELAGFYPQVQRTGPVKLARLQTSAQRAFAASMVHFMDKRVRAGRDADVVVEVFTIDDGTIVGGTVDLKRGSSLAHGHFDFDGAPFYADENMEWSGS